MTSGQLEASLSNLGTATIADALDRLGVHGTCLGIKPIGAGFSLAGRARTVRYGPCGPIKGTVGDFVEDYAPGTIAVLDNSARTDCTVWGDILTEFAHRNQLGGTVIDGVCRDTDLYAQLGYPVFARGQFMRTGKDRVQVEQLDGPVSIGGVRVACDDIVIGDSDGVVVVPSGLAEEILDAALDIAQQEDQIRRAIRAGSRLSEARSQYGYHSLQSNRAQAT